MERISRMLYIICSILTVHSGTIAGLQFGVAKVCNFFLSAGG